MSNTYLDLNLTVFPERVDNFPNWLNITAQDGLLVKQYVEAMNLGDINLASQILSQIPNGIQKIIKATDLNKLSQAMLALERFYGSDIKDYIETKQESWLKTINSLVYKGDWSAGGSNTYSKNNMVSYTTFGSEHIFIAVQNVPSGVPPTNTNYWRDLTMQGEQGESGVGLSYREEWLPDVLYSENDAVTYSGILWMALSASKGVEPSKNSQNWKLVMSLEATSYPVQDNPPLYQEVGALWFDTKDSDTGFYYLSPLQSPATASDIAVGKEAYDQNGNLIVGTKA